MKRHYLLLPLLGFVLTAGAQTQRLSMQDAMVNARTTLAPENLSQLQFIYGTENYVYAKNINNQLTWVSGNVSQATEKPLITLAQLNQKLRTAKRDTLKAMPVIQFNKGTSWLFPLNKAQMAYDPAKDLLTTKIDSSVFSKLNVEQSTAGYTAYLDKANLFVAKDSVKNQVTTDGSGDIVYASSVHRDEFGISKGIFWSNNGKVLAFYRMDQSMVADYPIIDWSTRPAKNVNIKYPMAGEKSHQVTVGVYNAETKTTVYLKTGEPKEQYLTNIAWSPDDKYIYIAVLNREQNHMKLNQYDAVTGNFMKTLFEEKDEKYVEPLEPMLFVENKPSQFIWQSNRDGWNHLYLYKANGKLVKQLTKGDWEVLDVKGFDAKGENLFYVSTAESPITRNLYTLNLKTGKSKRLTQRLCRSQYTISSSGKTVIDNFSSPENPRTIQLVETAGW